MSNVSEQPVQQVVVAARESNGLGVAGFVVSLVGLLLTCGLLCPIGLLFSVVALLKRPRGMAVAGTVLGSIGTTWLLLCAFLMLAGLANKCNARRKMMHRAGTEAACARTEATLARAKAYVEQHQAETGELPDGIDGDKLVIDLEDGWDGALRYELEDDGFVIRSAGPDRKFRTDDDMTITGGGLTGEEVFSEEADEPEHD